MHTGYPVMMVVAVMPFVDGIHNVTGHGVMVRTTFISVAKKRRL